MNICKEELVKKFLKELEVGLPKKMLPNNLIKIKFISL